MQYYSLHVETQGLGAKDNANIVGRVLRPVCELLPGASVRGLPLKADVLASLQTLLVNDLFPTVYGSS